MASVGMSPSSSGSPGGRDAACALDQPAPYGQGQLVTRARCQVCCHSITLRLHGPPDPCADQGGDGTCSGSGGRVLPGTPEQSGPSPIDLDYQIDLTGIPARGYVVAATATYQIETTPGSPVVWDDGGTADPTNHIVQWNQAGIAYLNASLCSGAMPTIHAHCQGFSGDNALTAEDFVVSYCLRPSC